MPWTKQINETHTARVDNASLQLRFFYGDAQASPPNALRAELAITIDRPDGTTEVRIVDAALANIAALTPTVPGATGRAQLMNALAILRDAGLAALGFTET